MRVSWETIKSDVIKEIIELFVRDADAFTSINNNLNVSVEILFKSEISQDCHELISMQSGVRVYTKIIINGLSVQIGNKNFASSDH